MNEVKNIREIKSYAEKLPDPARTLILSEPDEMSSDEFLVKFIEWRKLIRMSIEVD